MQSREGSSLTLSSFESFAQDFDRVMAELAIVFAWADFLCIGPFHGDL